MNKEIKYGGYSANPNDHESVEGDLAVAMNLIPEDATIKPVLPPSDVLNLQGNTLLAIHATAAFKHYILLDGYGAMSWLDAGDTSSGADLPHSFAGSVVHKVEPIGNTLVVLADDGLHYFLWKHGEYQYLGTHLPELDLRFYTTADSVPITSEQHEVDLGDESAVAEINTNKELCARLHQAILASANQVVSMVLRKHQFAFPFFVRYAFRLYDGETIIMHSAPALIVPSVETPEILMGWTIIPGSGRVEGPAKISAKLLGHVLHYHALDSDQVDEVARWSDIIYTVDVFISPQFYTYDQAERDDEYSVQHPLKRKDIDEAIRNNGSFHLIKSIKINDIFCGDGEQSTADGVNRPSEARPRANTITTNIIEPDFEPSNDNIVVRELMSDDYGTHDELFADKAFAYNNRINLAGVSKRLYNGFNPACMWSIFKDNQTSKITAATVVIEQDSREIIVRREPVSIFFDSDNTVVWFFYPDAGAKRAYLDIDGVKVTFELTQHPMLNGAYFYGLASDATTQPVYSIPTPSTDEQRLVAIPNKVYTSEANNPFYFPATGINSISSGEIKGICAAVRPMSSGQYGYADLYIFADNGIWTAKINDKGSYSNLDFATGDVCINPDSITQMETAVLFTTDRGIMLISGSQSQCISDAIDDKGQADAGMSGHVGTMAGLQGLGAVSVCPFREYMRSCGMLYDYEGQRVFVYNRAYNYAYIYSLESHKWGMTQSNIDYTVRAYPAAMAVTRSGHLVNYSEPAYTNVVHSLLVTRPLSLELPDVLKTITDVLQRGLFSKRAGHVKSVLLASNDMLEWRIIQTSTDEDLRGYRGTPYKWFRVALLLDLAPGESVTGCSVQFDTKYTNRLR